MPYNPSMQIIADWMAKMTRKPDTMPLILEVRSSGGLWYAQVVSYNDGNHSTTVLHTQNGVNADSAIRKLASRLPS